MLSSTYTTFHNFPSEVSQTSCKTALHYIDVDTLNIPSNPYAREVENLERFFLGGFV